MHKERQSTTTRHSSKRGKTRPKHRKKTNNTAQNQQTHHSTAEHQTAQRNRSQHKNATRHGHAKQQDAPRPSTTQTKTARTTTERQGTTQKKKAENIAARDNRTQQEQPNKTKRNTAPDSKAREPSQTQACHTAPGETHNAPQTAPPTAPHTSASHSHRHRNRPRTAQRAKKKNNKQGSGKENKNQAPRTKPKGGARKSNKAGGGKKKRKKKRGGGALDAKAQGTPGQKTRDTGDNGGAQTKEEPETKGHSKLGNPSPEGAEQRRRTKRPQEKVRRTRTRPGGRPARPGQGEHAHAHTRGTRAWRPPTRKGRSSRPHETALVHRPSPPSRSPGLTPERPARDNPERVRRRASPEPLPRQGPAAGTKSPVLGRPPRALCSRPVKPGAQAPGMGKGTTASGKPTGAPRATGPNEARGTNTGP